MSAIITPGAVRMRATPQDGDEFATSLSFSALEVQQADGSWVPLRGVQSATITIEPAAYLNATIHLHLTMIEATVPAECVSSAKRV